VRFHKPGLTDHQGQRVELALSDVQFGVIRRRVKMVSKIGRESDMTFIHTISEEAAEGSAATRYSQT
jgi:hypothetical protein